MGKHLTLSIPSSCTEHWSKMAPERHGRYCSSCEKSVVDFTHMTDAELIRYFKTLKGQTCGRFAQEQLNRDIAFPKKAFPWLKYFLRVSIPAFLLSFKSDAIGRKIAAPIEAAPLKQNPYPTDTTLKTVVQLQGVVLDDKGAPLQGASVYIKAAAKGVATDSLGRFALADVNAYDLVLFSYVGYETIEAIAGQLQQPSMEIQLSPVVLREVVTLGFVVSTVRKKATKQQKKPFELATPSIKVYPNPVVSGGIITVKGKGIEKGSYRAELYTHAGQLIQSSQVSFGKDGGMMNVKIDKLLFGTYVLKLTHERSLKHFSEQVVVKD